MIDQSMEEQGKMILHGHVSNEPIFPTDESIKLYEMFFVWLVNSNVALGQPAKGKRLNYFLDKIDLTVRIMNKNE